MRATRKETRLRRRKRLAGVFLGALLAALLCLAVFGRHRRTVTPDQDAVFTSTRYVTGLAVAPDGTVWAGTQGGLLEYRPNGDCRKFTRLDGLPSHEIRRLSFRQGMLTAETPRGTACWRNGHMQVMPNATPPDPPRFPGQTCATTWRGAPCIATLQGLHFQHNRKWRLVSLPPSNGTHISALWPHDAVLWAALFGDGIWTFDGTAWKPLNLAVPPEAREITAMAEAGGNIWLGTRRAGVWQYQQGHWINRLPRAEPIDQNCQALTAFHGSLFAGTLEDGLAVKTPQGWGHGQSPLLSSDAPRQMVVFGDRLYLRHGNGCVDSFDGSHWQRNVCAGLPRKQASALAADSERLYVAQWGGWSEFDGKTWTHHLDLPELQGLPITALCPDDRTLWIGTQTRGIAAFDRATGRLTWHDERDGLPDDWITVLLCVDHALYAGTFVGGLAQRHVLSPQRTQGFTEGKAGTIADGQWKTTPQLKGQNVTALAPDDAGGLFIATRNGVWHQFQNGTLKPLAASARFLDPEAQALCRVPGGLWVGTRTGLYFLSAP